ncbi:unnamed protein product [Cyclocybe aegerita]|uniref:Virilizer N-terminal domain-containing protein n=1 Tax=Cyclocybe aegerita TaxID=1973307 RepID=A0A8S0VQ47_CYCAE|nr:unnamed protein product [Cyclocybe aegerita]
MGLLQWCELRPEGPSGDIAAVLFPQPVRVSSIRIFPTGAQPFSQSPTTVAETEPEAFYLNVYFNAQAVPTPAGCQETQSQDKRQTKNALVPTRIAFAGGQTDFSVDMGSEYATRLVIFQGDFQVISMAIYGERVTEYEEVTDYEPKPLPTPSHILLPSALDVTNSAKPVSLVHQILSLLPSPPPLSLIIRLMFCLKPDSEDWDDPEFPYVYSDLDKRFNEDDVESEVFDLESLVKTVSKPLRDDVSVESLNEFAERMQDFLISNTPDDVYYVAKLLTKSACQQTIFLRTLLQHLNLPEVFNEDVLDEATVLCLLEASSNIEISRYFRDDEPFLLSLEAIQSSLKVEKPTQKALKRLLARIRGWETFEDALTNSNGDFVGAAAFLKDISMEEYALGCWLECMINHEGLVSKLEQTSPAPGSQPPLLFQDRQAEVTHDDFLAFVRAFLGIMPVLAALAWADSIGNNMCTERVLGILVIWQGVKGYREILNHGLLLRQMTRRLQWIKNDADNQQPKKSGILAERLVVGLAKDPIAMLRDDLITAVLSLKPPFSFIEEDEILEMGKLAKVARDGLLSAIDELAYNSVRPFSLRRLRVLRVSIAIITEELNDDDGPWRVLESFWNEHGQGLIPRLVTILSDLSDDLNQHFTLHSIPRMHQALAELLFRTADDFMHLITHFASHYPLVARDLQRVATAVSDLYSCSDATTGTFSRASPAYLAAQSVRETCPGFLSRLSQQDVPSEPDGLVAQAMLRTLFDNASRSVGRDPVQQVLLVYNLVDSIFPQDEDPGSSSWTASVFPTILSELRDFCNLLDPKTQVRFIERLVKLDNEETGLGAWLLAEELQRLSTVFEDLPRQQDPNYQLLLQYQLSASFRLLHLLMTSPTLSSWTISTLSSNADLSQLLDSTLSHILEVNVSSSPLAYLTRELAKHSADFTPDTRQNILLLLLRNAQTDPSVAGALDFVPGTLQSVPSTSIAPVPLRNELGRTLSAYSDHASTMKADTAELVLQMLEWLSSQEDAKLKTLVGIAPEGLDYLCTTLSAILPPPRAEVVSSIRARLSTDEDELLLPPTIELPDPNAFALPLSALENLLERKKLKEPSTPTKGTKTPDILGVVISPPTALLRSPAATGLTKTYANNDFRQLRQMPSTRLNTSRLPSTHVDEFGQRPTASPEMGMGLLLPAMPLDPLGGAYQGISGML